MPKITAPKTAESEKTRLQILVERKDRHLKNVAKIEEVLARQSAFLAYGTKAKARARYRDLYLRSTAPAADLKLLGIEPAKAAEKIEAAIILGLFNDWPWGGKESAPAPEKNINPA